VKNLNKYYTRSGRFFCLLWRRFETYLWEWTQVWQMIWPGNDSPAVSGLNWNSINFWLTGALPDRISSTFPEIEIIPKEELSLFSSCGYSGQFFVFLNISTQGFPPVRATSSTELLHSQRSPYCYTLMTLWTHQWRCVWSKYCFRFTFATCTAAVVTGMCMHHSLFCS